MLAAAFGIDLSHPVNFQTAIFGNLSDLLANISSPLTGSSTNYPQMCFGVVIDEPVNGSLSVNLVFSGFDQDPGTQGIPSQLKDVWNEFAINQDTSSFNLYTT